MEFKKSEITLKMISQALMLDKKYYPTQYWLSFEQCTGYFGKNNQIYIMLLDEDEVIGYLNFSPIRDDKFIEISSGKCIDTTILPDDIEEYNPGNFYSAYLSSIVIDEKYRHIGLGNQFLELLAAKIVALYHEKIYIKRIVADVLNEAGEKLAKNFGLLKTIKTKNGSTIYQAELIPHINMVPTEYNGNLIDLYKRGINDDWV